MRAFPKIFTIGTDYIRDIFKHDVEITEKVDGSQFGFGKFDGRLFIRSKKKQLFPESPEKMFSQGIDHICSIEKKLPEGIMFYAEYLKNPHHNTLTYNRIPRNHLILFGAMDKTEKFVSSYKQLAYFADFFGIEAVPLIYKGIIDNPDFLLKLLERESVLGGCDIEGLVVKNYTAPFLLGGQPIPVMAGKFVSEKFKEVHQKGWSKSHTHKGKWELFKESYRTEARWAKAVQHLRDEGALLNSPKDIGGLIKAIKEDIADEEIETIKNFLWKEFGTDLLRWAVKGFPEWYKEQLLRESF